jgi:hypothetical protein
MERSSRGADLSIRIIQVLLQAIVRCSSQLRKRRSRARIVTLPRGTDHLRRMKIMTIASTADKRLKRKLSKMLQLLNSYMQTKRLWHARKALFKMSMRKDSLFLI